MTKSSFKIDTVQARSRLKPQHDPYYVSISRGLALGYRKPSDSALGTWVVRVRDSSTGATKRHSLGDYADTPAAGRYSQALKDAQKYTEHLRNGGSTSILTVKETCDAYIQQLRERGRGPTADDASGRFKRWVNSDPIGVVALSKLTRRSVDRWRTNLIQTAVVINPYASKPKTRARSPASINRDMSVLKAALNFAHDHGYVDSDNAWRVALKPIANATRRREVYLSSGERNRLLQALNDEIRPMARAMALLPLRPGVFAKLTVNDFDQRQETLRIEKDKKSKDRRIPLSEEAVNLFIQCSSSKDPDSFIFQDGKCNPWNKDSWKKQFKAGAIAAKLPLQVSAYTFRHSVITDLISIHNLDINTVAIISGTSARMIEEHYGHLVKEKAVAALDALAKYTL